MFLRESSTVLIASSSWRISLIYYFNMFYFMYELKIYLVFKKVKEHFYLQRLLACILSLTGCVVVQSEEASAVDSAPSKTNEAFRRSGIVKLVSE